MNGFSSHVTACFNRITNNPESFMLSTMSCNVSSHRFSPNSHLFSSKKGDDSKTNRYTVAFINHQTLWGHNVVAPMYCLLSSSHTTNITAS